MAQNRLDDKILDEIKRSILSKDYGSVEIYIERGEVVQITERTIKKTNNKMKSNGLGKLRTYSAYNSTVKR